MLKNEPAFAIDGDRKGERSPAPASDHAGSRIAELFSLGASKAISETGWTEADCAEPDNRSFASWLIDVSACLAHRPVSHDCEGSHETTWWMRGCLPASVVPHKKQNGRNLKWLA